MPRGDWRDIPLAGGVGGPFTATCDWSKCAAFEGVPDRVGGAWEFKVPDWQGDDGGAARGEHRAEAKSAYGACALALELVRPLRSWSSVPKTGRASGRSSRRR